MKWPWTPQPVPDNPEPPEGVVLHYRGRAVTCSVLREPGADEHGCAAWLAVPDEPLTLRYGEDFRLTATLLPAHTLLLADLGLEHDEEPWPGPR
jgi:hypothetical protein